MQKILVIEHIPDDLRGELSKKYEIHDCYKADNKDEIIDAIADEVQIILQGGATILETALIDRLPNLKLIAICGVGYDGVPLDACRERGIAVANTPDVLTDDVADIALALVIMTCRRLLYANRFLLAHQWEKSEAELSMTLAGKKVGILGMGRIGKAIAQRLTACRMDVVYCGRTRQEIAYDYFADLNEMARAVDMLVIACPGGDATRHLVDRKVLKSLGPKGILINVGRASVTDEAALIEVLENKEILGAGLDAFENEPVVAQRMLDLKNAVLFPHVGSATIETRTKMADLCFQNITAFSAGKALLTPVL